MAWSVIAIYRTMFVLGSISESRCPAATTVAPRRSRRPGSRVQRSHPRQAPRSPPFGRFVDARGLPAGFVLVNALGVFTFAAIFAEPSWVLYTARFSPLVVSARGIVPSPAAYAQGVAPAGRVSGEDIRHRRGVRRDGGGSDASVSDRGVGGEERRGTRVGPCDGWRVSRPSRFRILADLDCDAVERRNATRRRRRRWRDGRGRGDVRTVPVGNLARPTYYSWTTRVRVASTRCEPSGPGAFLSGADGTSRSGRDAIGAAVTRASRGRRVSAPAGKCHESVLEQTARTRRRRAPVRSG